jgi:uncharacterized protein
LSPTGDGGCDMKQLVETIAKTLVDHPDDVEVRAVGGSKVIVIEWQTHPDDLGKVIGHDGRTAQAIRTLLVATGIRLNKRCKLEILDAKPATQTSAR